MDKGFLNRWLLQNASGYNKSPLAVIELFLFMLGLELEAIKYNLIYLDLDSRLFEVIGTLNPVSIDLFRVITL